MVATDKVPAIYAAMGEVFKGLANVEKKGVGPAQQGGYAYLKADDVQAALNPLLSANNVIVQAPFTAFQAERGTKAWVYVELEIRYCSTIDGSVWPPREDDPIKATGESVGTDDKSVNKALTQAIKNAHRATFQFASGEKEPDDAPHGVDMTQPSAIEKAAEKAKATTAKPAAAKSTTSPLREKVRLEWIEKGKADKDYVNALVTEAKSKSIEGDDVWKYVMDKLEASDA